MLLLIVNAVHIKTSIVFFVCSIFFSILTDNFVSIYMRRKKNYMSRNTDRILNLNFVQVLKKNWIYNYTNLTSISNLQSF